MSDLQLTAFPGATLVNGRLFLFEPVCLERRKEFSAMKIPEETEVMPISPKEQPLYADPGMIEISIALSGVAIAIAAFLPGVSDIPAILRLVGAMLSSVVAAFSAYSALWLLACYCRKVDLRKSSSVGIKEICLLFGSPGEVGPYFLLALGLLFLLALAVFVCASIVGR